MSHRYGQYWQVWHPQWYVLICPPYSQILFKSNLHIVLNISCKFHSCVKTLKSQNYWASFISLYNHVCGLSGWVSRRAVGTVLAPPTPPPSTPYTQKLFKSNVYIVVNISCKFHKCLNILTSLINYVLKCVCPGRSWVSRDGFGTPPPHPPAPHTPQNYSNQI